MLTQTELKARLRYDPDTGQFTWLAANGRRTDQIGMLAGNKSKHGYMRITINRRSYFAHRLAWLYMTGSEPANFIDHINMVKHDNRWANLRAATKSQNNTHKPGRAASGLKGVYWNNSGSCYSRIGKRYLGAFKTEQEAHAAYVAAANEVHGPFACNLVA